MIDKEIVKQFVLENFVEQIPDDSSIVPDDLEDYTYFKLDDGYQYKVSNDKVLCFYKEII